MHKIHLNFDVPTINAGYNSTKSYRDFRSMSSFFFDCLNVFLHWRIVVFFTDSKLFWFIFSRWFYKPHTSSAQPKLRVFNKWLEVYISPVSVIRWFTVFFLVFCCCRRWWDVSLYYYCSRIPEVSQQPTCFITSWFKI